MTCWVGLMFVTFVTHLLSVSWWKSLPQPWSPVFSSLALSLSLSRNKASTLTVHSQASSARMHLTRAMHAGKSSDRVIYCEVTLVVSVASFPFHLNSTAAAASSSSAVTASSLVPFACDASVNMNLSLWLSLSLSLSLSLGCTVHLRLLLLTLVAACASP